MSIRIFQPFQKVWTPRTPDSSYDSLGAPPLGPIVMTPLITEGISDAVIVESGVYETAIEYRSSSEGAGSGIVLHSGQYTPA